MVRKIFLAFTAVFFLLAAGWASGQTSDTAIHVTVTMNTDGSKTVSETDGASHRCVATTTGANGRVREKIIYRLDTEGRYESGEVFTGRGVLRFRSLYRYDSAGRLAEETQTGKDGAVLHKIIYQFDAEGHPKGYAVYDGEGNLLGQTSSKPARPNR